MNILVMGAGAIGSVFGGFLAKDGHQVTLIGRNPHMSEIQKNGLKISGIWKEHSIHCLKTFTDLNDIDHKDYDLVLFCVKTFDSKNTAKIIAPLIRKNCLLVSLQNGINNYEKINAFIPSENIIMGRVIFGVELKAPGHVYISVYAEEVQLGRPEQNSEIPIEIAEVFSNAGIPTQATSDIKKYIWAKLLYNCALNPLSALLCLPYGELPKKSSDLLRSVIHEIFAVAKAEKIKLFWNEAKEYEDLLFETLIPRTASHYASMYQDMKRHKKTEIDALNGAIVNLAKKQNISVPANRLLTTLIKHEQRKYG